MSIAAEIQVRDAEIGQARTKEQAPSRPPHENVTASKPSSGRRLVSFDGLRTIAVFGVMAVHSGIPGCELGWIGVEVFFVLSGFLITSLLMTEFNRVGKINLAKFYLRRSLRLLPAYWLYVASVSIAVVLTPYAHHVNASGWNARWYIASLWGYFVNYCPMDGVWDYQWLTIHLWSLSVEMQFYFLWPLIVVSCLMLSGRRLTLLAGCLGVLVTALFLTALSPDGTVDTSILSRGFAIAVGALAAILISYGIFDAIVASTKFGNTAVAVGMLSLCIATWLFCRGDVGEISLHRYFALLFSLTTACVVACLWKGKPWWLSSCLERRPLAYLGEISYGIYLYHIFVSWIIWTAFPQWTALQNRYLKFGLRLTLYFGGTLIIAYLSYRFLEKPCLALKERLKA